MSREMVKQALMAAGKWRVRQAVDDFPIDMLIELAEFPFDDAFHSIFCHSLKK